MGSKVMEVILLEKDVFYAISDIILDIWTCNLAWRLIMTSQIFTYILGSWSQRSKVTEVILLENDGFCTISNIILDILTCKLAWRMIMTSQIFTYILGSWGQRSEVMEVILLEKDGFCTISDITTYGLVTWHGGRYFWVMGSKVM